MINSHDSIIDLTRLLVFLFKIYFLYPFSFYSFYEQICLCVILLMWEPMQAYFVFAYVQYALGDGQDGVLPSSTWPPYSELLSRKMTILSVSERSTSAPILKPRITQAYMLVIPRSIPVKRNIRWITFNVVALILERYLAPVWDSEKEDLEKGIYFHSQI